MSDDDGFWDREVLKMARDGNVTQRSLAVARDAEHGFEGPEWELGYGFARAVRRAWQQGLFEAPMAFAKLRGKRVPAVLTPKGEQWLAELESGES